MNDLPAAPLPAPPTAARLTPARAGWRRAARLLLVATGLSFLTLPAMAGDEAAEGIDPGATMPRFLLPVVNGDTFTAAKKWGPNKWVGASAKPEEQKKVMLMSFFATWCEPCKKEMPELVRLHETYGEQGLGVMLVSIDERKEREALASFTADKALPFPVVHDAWGVVARRYKYPGRLPYLVMGTGDGKVASSHVGYAEDFKDELERLVRERLGLPPLAKAAEEPKPEETKVAEPEDGKQKKRKSKKRSRRSKKKKKGDD